MVPLEPRAMAATDADGAGASVIDLNGARGGRHPWRQLLAELGPRR
jgi:hypothetical protein